MSKQTPISPDHRELIQFVDMTSVFGLLAVSIICPMGIVIAFKCAFILYGLFVLKYAAQFAREIPTTFRGQRGIGALLYLTSHSVMLLPGMLALPLVAYVMFAAPLSVVFLFE